MQYNRKQIVIELKTLKGVNTGLPNPIYYSAFYMVKETFQDEGPCFRMQIQ